MTSGSTFMNAILAQYRAPKKVKEIAMANDNEPQIHGSSLMGVL